ncbi:uncharacterized protein LOC142984348 [Anticarsia gemmatalis]|uniref:uncharacterized protein LOC142984348 n=1 Tax=Anticarsia gemmatalis TaxID=129554 RepID=UPI003F76CCDC
MRFLVAFVAILGYASASVIAPLAYGINAGDAQAAAIDATVAAQDHARAFTEGQARAAEAAIQYNNEAARQVAETNRDLHENAYWGSLAANQNAVAAAQSHAAAVSGVAAAQAGLAAAHAGYAAPYVAGPYGYAGIAAAPYIAAPYAAHGLAYRGW